MLHREDRPAPTDAAAARTLRALADSKRPGSDQRAAWRILGGCEDTPVHAGIGVLAERHQDQSCAADDQHEKRKQNGSFALYSTALITQQKWDYGTNSSHATSVSKMPLKCQQTY
jgi:hypothetical protein